MLEEDPNIFELSEDNGLRSEISTPIREEAAKDLLVELKLPNAMFRMHRQLDVSLTKK